MLVPEIGLTPQTVGRFRRLNVPMAAYHSALTPVQRLQIWQQAHRGELSLIIATRSGIFLPLHRLKAIFIDEEHDTSYKQEERFCYHARDLALWKAKQLGLLVVMGSATPSLESLHRAREGKIELHRLSQRPDGRVLPQIEIVDRRNIDQKKNSENSFITERLEIVLKETVRRGEQALLFLNRRGLSPFVLCPSCGFVPRCEDCDISYTLHVERSSERGSKADPRLVCHYCDKTIRYEPVCTACRQGSLQPQGHGTERLVSDVKRLLPGARVARLDRDASSKGGWHETLEKMRRKEIDVLVGTQLVTKGHDFPELTLVGILDPDSAMNLPDFRSTERTFQTITQVAGRAGRGKKGGRVLLQTFHPADSSLLNALEGNPDAFYEREITHRREAGYPPFRRLIEIRLSATRQEVVRKAIDRLSKRILSLQTGDEPTLLGPAPCLVERVRNRFRWRLLLKCTRYARLQPALAALLDDFASNDLPSTARMTINVDPMETA